MMRGLFYGIPKLLKYCHLGKEQVDSGYEHLALNTYSTLAHMRRLLGEGGYVQWQI